MSQFDRRWSHFEDFVSEDPDINLRHLSESDRMVVESRVAKSGLRARCLPAPRSTEGVLERARACKLSAVPPSVWLDLDRVAAAWNSVRPKGAPRRFPRFRPWIHPAFETRWGSPQERSKDIRTQKEALAAAAREQIRIADITARCEANARQERGRRHALAGQPPPPAALAAAEPVLRAWVRLRFPAYDWSLVPVETLQELLDQTMA